MTVTTTMQKLLSPIVVSLCIATLFLSAAGMPSREEIRTRQREIRARRAAAHAGAGADAKRDTAGAQPGSRASTITFSNPAAAAFHVPGTSIPDVDFDVGDSWSVCVPPERVRSLMINIRV